MKSLTVSEAKEILGDLVQEVNSEHEPVHIRAAGTSAVLLDEEDWRAIQETIYLLSVPGMRESIREGLQTPAHECCEELNW
ncbi:MAG: type II toxin-antitoxin system Phd/YefM family antitoxin [Armatimonadota bacterium]